MIKKKHIKYTHITIHCYVLLLGLDILLYYLTMVLFFRGALQRLNIKASSIVAASKLFNIFSVLIRQGMILLVDYII